MSEQQELGEGARWDARRGELLRVDIVSGRVYRDRVTDEMLEIVEHHISRCQTESRLVLGAGGIVQNAPD